MQKTKLDLSHPFYHLVAYDRKDNSIHLKRKTFIAFFLVF